MLTQKAWKGEMPPPAQWRDPAITPNRWGNRLI
jgi:hypothetical protein